MTKDAGKFLGALLRSPGMSDDVKISLKFKRRDILLLDEIIDIGTTSDELKGVLAPEWVQELKEFSAQLLTRADISEEFMASYKESFSVKRPG